ncbi:MAG: hypothetical protein DI569_11120 [Sphingopyxis macrogoltabida]|uniref:FAD-binding domain-containing protein n=1 Tax=Sphingopyxis macrogoltabida TaxID=33050 RepID=A0A2W5MPD1_SPHMC|nr:MAG: hypothetical protein DI569_11120 [Sphingopyxis macrogoltabida]
MRAALVIGDGPAGLLAAIALRRAGWAVQIAPGRRTARAHHGHVHQIAPATIAGIEAIAGRRVAGWSLADQLRIDGHAPSRVVAAPLVDPAALVRALSRHAVEAGAGFAEPCMAIPIGGEAFGLLVDASGSSVLASRTPGLHVAIDESDATDICWTWRGTAGRSDAPWTIAARNVGRADGLWMIRTAEGRCTMTVRSPHGGDEDGTPFHLLDSLMLAAGHDWARRMGGVRLDRNPVRHCAPYARRVEVALSPGAIPLVRIGDGLIQTAPRFGQGFAQIVEQIGLLQVVIAARGTPADAIASIETSADRRWLAAMVGVASQPLVAA